MSKFGVRLLLILLVTTSCRAKEPEATKPPPDWLALLLLIDKSGSMAGQGIEIAKEASLNAAKFLSGNDLLGVLAFDTRPHWILGFTEGDKMNVIEPAIGRLWADGGTQIYPALVEALQGFQGTPRAKDATLKHLILLSDGVTPAADIRSIIRRMMEEGITVSTVCIGSSDGFDAPLMSRIAEWGGGRFYFTENLKKIPHLFGKEVERELSEHKAGR